MGISGIKLSPKYTYLNFSNVKMDSGNSSRLLRSAENSSNLESSEIQAGIASIRFLSSRSSTRSLYSLISSGTFFNFCFVKSSRVICSPFSDAICASSIDSYMGAGIWGKQMTTLNNQTTIPRNTERFIIEVVLCLQGSTSPSICHR